MSRTDHWIAALQDTDPEVRLEALKQCHSIPLERRVPLLVPMLGDLEWRVRKAASTQLKLLIPTPELLNGLLDCITQQDDPWRRTAAMEVLVERGVREAEESTIIPFLLSALTRVDVDNRKFIVELLGDLTSTEALSPLIVELQETDENLQLSVLEALAKIGDQAALPAMIERLQHGTIQVKFAALSALQQLGDRSAIPAVCEAFDQKPLRSLVLETLGFVGDHSVIDPLWNSWVSGSDHERSCALVSMVQIVERLEAHERSQLIASLASLYTQTHTTMLLQQLDSTDPRVQSAAIVLAGWVREPAAISSLVNCLAGDQATRAAQALSLMAGDHMATLLDLVPRATPTIHRGLMQILSRVNDHRLLPMMREALTSQDGHVKSAAALALGAQHDASSAAALVQLLTDPYPDVQESALCALGHCRNSEVIPSVMTLLSHASPVIRKNAALALGQLQAHECCDRLILALNDPEAVVRAAALSALDTLESSSSLEHLLLACGDESAAVRLTAVKALQRHVTELPVQRWAFLADDPDIWVRTAAARLAGLSSDQEARPMLNAFLHDMSGAVRIAALEVIDEHPEQGDVSQVKGSLTSDDPDVIQAALRALAAMGGQHRARVETTPSERDTADDLAMIIQDCLGHPSWAVRIESLKLLAQRAPNEALTAIQDQLLHDTHPRVREVSRQLCSQLLAGELSRQAKPNGTR